jgi:hypothetical protein
LIEFNLRATSDSVMHGRCDGSYTHASLIMCERPHATLPRDTDNTKPKQRSRSVISVVAVVLLVLSPPVGARSTANVVNANEAAHRHPPRPDADEGDTSGIDATADDTALDRATLSNGEAGHLLGLERMRRLRRSDGNAAAGAAAGETKPSTLASTAAQAAAHTPQCNGVIDSSICAATLVGHSRGNITSFCATFGVACKGHCPSSCKDHPKHEGSVMPRATAPSGTSQQAAAASDVTLINVIHNQNHCDWEVDVLDRMLRGGSGSSTRVTRVDARNALGSTSSASDPTAPCPAAVNAVMLVSTHSMCHGLGNGKPGNERFSNALERYLDRCTSAAGGVKPVVIHTSDECSFLDWKTDLRWYSKTRHVFRQ